MFLAHFFKDLLKIKALRFLFGASRAATVSNLLLLASLLRTPLLQPFYTALKNRKLTTAALAILLLSTLKSKKE
jgi:hypothetical protein